MLQQIESALRESFARVLTKVATLLPAVAALILALAISALLGALLAFLVRRILAALHFDERMRDSSTTGALEWSSIRSPTLLIARIAFWGCIVAGAVVGISAFAAAYGDSERLAEVMLPYVAHTVGAAVLLLLGTMAARFLARTVLIGAVNMNLRYAQLLSQSVRWMVLVITLAMVLDHLSIAGVIVELAFGILFGGIVLTLSLVIGLGKSEAVLRSLSHEEPLYPEETRVGSVRHF